VTRAHVRVLLPHRELAVLRVVVVRALQPFTAAALERRQRGLPLPRTLEAGHHRQRAWGRVEALVEGELPQIREAVLEALRRALYPGHHPLLEQVGWSAEPVSAVPLTRQPEGP
jgi:hypothetical protein